MNQKESKDVQSIKHHLMKIRNNVKSQPTSQYPSNVNSLIEVLNRIQENPAIDNSSVWKEIFIILNTIQTRKIEKLTQFNSDDVVLILQNTKKLFQKLVNENLVIKFTEKQQLSIQSWINEPTQNLVNNTQEFSHVEEVTKVPRRLQVVEAVLERRTNRIALVLERCHKSLNYQAVLRTAECMGIQYIYLIDPPNDPQSKSKISKKITKGTEIYLTIKTFSSSIDCIQALHDDNREIWATDLSPQSINLETISHDSFPARVALVIGNEVDGVSKEVLDAADRRIYLPMHGFADSLNLSVASALLVQHLFFMCPEARGNLDLDEKSRIRKHWYDKLARSNPKKKALYAHFLAHPPLPLTDLRKPEYLRQAYMPKKILKKINENNSNDNENREMCIEEQNV